MNANKIDPGDEVVLKEPENRYQELFFENSTLSPGDRITVWTVFDNIVKSKKAGTIPAHQVRPLEEDDHSTYCTLTVRPI